MIERHEPEIAPEARVDEMERRVLGATQDRERSPEHGGDGCEPTPAFEIDLEPEDQGTAAAAEEGSG